MNIHLPQRVLERTMLRLSTLVIACGFVAALWLAAVGADHAPVAVFFSLSYEGNLPTWFSSMLLLLCAALLVLAALGARQRGDLCQRHWCGLALGFAYISLDEAVQIHELVNGWFHLHGIFFFGWVIPAGILVVVLALCYLRFLKHLPAETRRDFLRAGVVYVGGALGVELILGYWTDLYGADTLGYALIDLVEESMEILGATLFLSALVRHLGRPDGVLRLVLTPSADQALAGAAAHPAARNIPRARAHG